MAFAWMLGSLMYCLRRIPHSQHMSPELKEYPKISVLIPCHNEGDFVRETMERMTSLDYPDYEVLAINDGSTDNTGDVLQECAQSFPHLRVITLETNQGKAMALKTGFLLSRSEYLVCVDADSFLSQDALKWIIWHFVNFPRVGAVTGNPRIRNRTTLLGKIQVGEYSTIIGMIKRTQRILGKVFTVSGVAAAYRKRALMDVGLWSEDMVTEDIDISWKLQHRFWDVRFEEKALCWILTPETIKGLWKQRVRWAQGGAEVIIKYFKSLFSRKQRRMWPVCVEYMLSVFWAYSFFFALFVVMLNLFFDLPEPYSVATIVPPEWTGTFLACVCLLQAFLALLFERRVEKGLVKYLFWFIWYPFAYWVLNAAATIVGLPKAIIRRQGVKAVWESPDRGLT